jgi:hypothetical protein
MKKNRVVAAVALSAGLVGGGAAGMMIGLTHISGAATTPSDTTVAPKSNENPTHESGEDAAREAAEDAGKAGFGRHGGGSNEDATHETSEDPAREAAEDAAKAAGDTQPTGTPAAPAASAAASG